MSPPPLVVSLEAPSKFEAGDFLAALLRGCCQAHIEKDSQKETASFPPASRRQRVKYHASWLFRKLVAVAALLAGVIALRAGVYVETSSDPTLEGARVTASNTYTQIGEQWDRSVDSAKEFAERALDVKPELTGKLLILAGVLIAVYGLFLFFGGPNKTARQGTLRTVDVAVREALRYLAYETEYENEAGAKARLGKLGEVTGRSKVRSSQRRTGFPELVAYAHRVIGQIATSRRASGCGLIVTIDELDRIGTGPEIEEFLAEIKGVFSAPATIFILAVTDEVGNRYAARSVLGTSRIDNVVDHVIPMTGWSLSEARQLLRGSGASVPRRYLKLAYAYAGQHPRELIRVVNVMAEDARLERNAGIPTPSKLGFRFIKSRLLDSCDQCLASIGSPAAASDREVDDIVKERRWILALREEVTRLQTAEEFVDAVRGETGAISALRGQSRLSLNSLGLLAQATVDGITLHFFVLAEERSRPGDIDVVILEELAASRRHIVNRPELAESLAFAALVPRV